jgi:hypothetical protein
MTMKTTDLFAMYRSSSAVLIFVIVIVVAVLSSSSCCHAFVITNVRLVGENDQLRALTSQSSFLRGLMHNKPKVSHRHDMVHNTHDADLMEVMMGGQRFEMVPLPDSMLDTTIFVGNLCEFAHDDDLSNVFQSVSRLQSVPACVVRKSNMASLQYAFVTFPTVEEKEVRFEKRDYGLESGERVDVCRR